MLMKFFRGSPLKSDERRMVKKILEAPVRIPRGASLAVRKEGAARSSRPPRSRFNRVPAELRALKQWVGWGKSFDPANPKRPIRVCPGQRFIKATIGNAEHWTTFEAACAAVDTQGIEGIGFHFDANDPYVGVDLDHCVEKGKISPAAKAIVDSLPECYWEISQSSTGLHGIGKGRKPGPNCKAVNPKPGIAAIEIYEKERHFCTTGRQIGRITKIGDIQDKLNELYYSLWPDEPDTAEQELEPACFQGSDEELIAKMFEARNGEKVKRLWDGDISAHGDDESAADFALMCHLAFYTGKDHERMERLFTLSTLGEREKWKSRADYRKRTIENACAKTKGVYGFDPSLPHGFKTDADGTVLHLCKDPGDKEPTYKPVCSDLKVIGLARDGDGESWHIIIDFTDPDGEPHRLLLPRTSFSGTGQEYRTLLLNSGVQIYRKGSLDQYLQNSRPLARARITARIGWHGDLFVLPDDVIGETETDEEAFMFVGPERQRHPFKRQGTTDEWREHIGNYCVGNSRLLFAVSCAFAGPLLPGISTATLGFHLAGPTSLGKTTALEVAGSVLGRGTGELGYLVSWRATSNGMEIQAAMHNNALLCLDEMAQVDPKIVGDLAYMLGNGRSKSRMTRDLGMAANYEWQLVFLSSGEITLEQHANEAGKRIKGGQRVRCLDIPADDQGSGTMFENLHGYSSSKKFSDNLKQATKHYYGSAFFDFVEKVAANRKAIQNRYAEMVKDLEGELAKDKGGEVARAARYFALIGAAGEIATELSITGFTVGECAAATRSCFQGWIQHRGTTGSSDEQKMFEQVKLFFEKHGDSRFDDLTQRYEEGRKPKIHNRAGVRAEHKGEVEYVIFSEVFRQEICQGFDPDTVADLLIERGIMPAEAGRKQVRRKVDGERLHHYVVREQPLLGNHVSGDEPSPAERSPTEPSLDGLSPDTTDPIF